MCIRDRYIKLWVTYTENDEHKLRIKFIVTYGFWPEELNKIGSRTVSLVLRNVKHKKQGIAKHNFLDYAYNNFVTYLISPLNV